MHTTLIVLSRKSHNRTINFGPGLLSCKWKHVVKLLHLMWQWLQTTVVEFKQVRSSSHNDYWCIWAIHKCRHCQANVRVIVNIIWIMTRMISMKDKCHWKLILPAPLHFCEYIIFENKCDWKEFLPHGKSKPRPLHQPPSTQK